MLDDKDKQKIKDLWLEGSSRDSIAISIGKDKNIVQAYIDEIYPAFYKKRKKLIKERIRDFEYSENDVLEDYKNGASYKYIKDKYHIGTTKVDNLITAHKELLDEHNKNATTFGKYYRAEAIENISTIDYREKEKLIKKLKVKHVHENKFFRREIRHLNFNAYCKLEFTGSVKIYTNATDPSKYGNQQSIPSTEIITKGIRGLGDYADFLALRNVHFNDIRDEYCYIANEKRIVSLNEFQNIIGFYE